MKELFNEIDSNLYYSKDENKLIAIPKSYTSGLSVIDRAKYQTMAANYLSTLAEVDANQVRGFPINSSKRFAGLYLYYVNDPKNVPDHASPLSGEYATDKLIS